MAGTARDSGAADGRALSCLRGRLLRTTRAAGAALLFVSLAIPSGTLLPAAETEFAAPAPAPFCEGEGSLHRMALDMVRRSSPPGSRSRAKLRRVALDGAPSYHVDLGAPVLRSNGAAMGRLLDGAGRFDLSWPARDDDGDAAGGPSYERPAGPNVTLVESFWTRSGCPLSVASCRDQPRIYVQTEQLLPDMIHKVWPPLFQCHEAPNCVAFEFSDHNLEAYAARGDLPGSVVLVPAMTQSPRTRLSDREPATPTPPPRRRHDVVFFGAMTERRRVLAGLAAEHEASHPGRRVLVRGQEGRDPDARARGAAEAEAYADAKVCLVAHSYGDVSGGEYHRLSEFGPFGCIPVVERFADSVGIATYARCGGVRFANFTDLLSVAEDVLVEIDRGLHDNHSLAIIDWWKAGIQWESILPTIFGVDEGHHRQ